MSKKYFITGGAGFIGSHTADRLIKEGNEVTVYDIKPWKEAVNLHHQKDAIKYIEGDIRKFEDLKSAMERHTHVLHLAAIASVSTSIEDPFTTHLTNVTGTLNVFEAARNLNIERVVYASSAAVYGDQEIFPIEESAPLKPTSPYGLHKVINDEYAALYNNEFGLSVMGLRYFNIFGTRQDPTSPYSGVITIFMDRAKQGDSAVVYGDGTATRDYIHIDNVVDANVKALLSSEGGVCNIASNVEVSVLDLIKGIESALGSPLTIEHTDIRAGDIVKSLASIERARTVLGYTVGVDFTEGLKKMLT